MLAARPVPPGRPGPTGVPGIEIVKGTGVLLVAGGQTTREAQCPAGKSAIGGWGFASLPELRVTRSQAADTPPTKWQASFVNDGAAPGMVQATVVCAKIG